MKKQPTSKAQTQLDEEDAQIRKKENEKRVRLLIEPFFSLCQKKEAYKKLKPEQVAFVFMLLQPRDERLQVADMARQLSVEDRTLYRWQNDPVIIELRFDMMHLIFKKHTPDILENLADRAKSRDPESNAVPAVKLWLQYVEDWKETQKLESNQPVFSFGFPPSQFIAPKKPKKKNG